MFRTRKSTNLLALTERAADEAASRANSAEDHIASLTEAITRESEVVQTERTKARAAAEATDILQRAGF